MLNKTQPSSNLRRLRFRSAWSLVELMVAVVMAMIVLGAVMVTFIFVNKSFVIIGNYHDLDKDSRHTLDVLTRDIRSISNVTYFASNEINLKDMNGNQIGYKWDGSNNFVRTFNGESQIMLKDCDYLKMNNYQRNSSTNFSFITASSTAETKLIDVEWHCWRPVLGSHLTTESVQTAKIVARNF